MANPRIDELRSRLQREPGSRLFAQLAEELRKDGDLTEAIRVARGGLALHPNYPSARLTLGRALIESGNLTAARTELESVLRGAPDNILASRMLAECLEGLGDLGAALLQFRAALRLSPDDRQIEGQIRALEQRLAGPVPARPPAPSTAPDGGTTLPPIRTPVGSPTPPPLPAVAHAPVAPSPVAPPVMSVAAPSPALSLPTPPLAPPPPAIPPKLAPPPAAGSPLPVAADFDDVFEAAPSWMNAGASAAPPESGPILLLEDEAPTLPGAPFSSPTPSPTPADAAEPARRPETAAFEAVPAPVGPVTLSFAMYPPPSAPAEAPPPAGSASGTDTLAGAPAFAPVADAPPAPPPFGAPGSEPGPAISGAFGAAPSAPAPVAESPFQPPPPAPPSASGATAVATPLPTSAEEAAPGLRSATLAELYLEQGFSDKAVEVYEQMLESDPYDQRARSRLIEIKRMGATTPAVTPAPREAALAPAAFEAPAPPPAALPPPLVDDPNAPRRRALERTIARLEKMLVTVRRQ